MRFGFVLIVDVEGVIFVYLFGLFFGKLGKGCVLMIDDICVFGDDGFEMVVVVWLDGLDLFENDVVLCIV